MTRNLLALLLVAWVSGCAWNPPPHVPLSERQAARLSTRKLWVVACLPWKRFVVEESLLRPWGYSGAGNFYSLHGIWDPAPAIEEAVVAGLQKRFGVSAVPLRSLVEREVFERLAEETGARSREASAAKQWDSWMEREADPLAIEACRRGGEYLLEVWVRLKVFRWVTARPGFLLYCSMRVLRLDTREVIWCRTGMGASEGAEVQDFREYAASDLALFKDAFRGAAARLSEPQPWNLLDGLFPERSE